MTQERDELAEIINVIPLPLEGKKWEWSKAMAKLILDWVHKNYEVKP